MDFAKILTAFRTANKLSQQETANRLGISRNYLSQIERGKAMNISFDLGLRILNLGSQHGKIEVTLPRRVLIDGHIAAEMVWLNQQGVHTEGCCQGPPPTTLVKPSSTQRCLELGYEPVYNKSIGRFSIRLKSRVPERDLSEKEA